MLCSAAFNYVPNEIKKSIMRNQKGKGVIRPIIGQGFHPPC